MSFLASIRAILPPLGRGALSAQATLLAEPFALSVFITATRIHDQKKPVSLLLKELLTS